MTKKLSAALLFLLMTPFISNAADKSSFPEKVYPPKPAPTDTPPAPTSWAPTSSSQCNDLSAIPRLGTHGDAAGDLVITGFTLKKARANDYTEMGVFAEITYVLINPNLEESLDNYWKSTVLVTTEQLAAISAGNNTNIPDQSLHCNIANPNLWTPGGHLYLRVPNIFFLNRIYTSPNSRGLTLSIDPYYNVTETNEDNNTIECTSFEYVCSGPAIPEESFSGVAASLYSTFHYLSSSYHGPCRVQWAPGDSVCASR